MQTEKRNWHQDKKTIESLKKYSGDDIIMLSFKKQLKEKGLTYKQIDLVEIFFEVEPYKNIMISELTKYEGENPFVISCKEQYIEKGFLTSKQIKALKNAFTITSNYSTGKKGEIRPAKRVTLKEMGIEDDLFEGLQDEEFNKKAYLSKNDKTL